MFIENRLLYGMKEPQPPAEYVLPIGKSAVVRAGSERIGAALGVDVIVAREEDVVSLGIHGV